MAKVKKRVLALSRGTNQAMRIHIVFKIKSLVKVTWSHRLNSHVLKWFKSHAQDMFAQREKTKLIATPHEAILRRNDIWRHWRLKWLKWLYSLDLEYRYAIPSKGIQYESLTSLKCLTNRTQVLTWEKTLSSAPALVDLGACSLLGWIVLETSFPESPWSL
jgi:hypothetical protein